MSKQSRSMARTIGGFLILSAIVLGLLAFVIRPYGTAWSVTPFCLIPLIVGYVVLSNRSRQSERGATIGKRNKAARQRRKWLIESLRGKLLPALLREGFVPSPAQELAPPVDREYLLCLPSWARLLRRREPYTDLLQVQLLSHGRAAFRINAAAICDDGMSTPAGHQTARQCIDLGFHNLEMYADPKRFKFFSIPWYRSRRKSDYDKMVQRVVDLLPELELALRGGEIGPHMRRFVLLPLSPDVMGRLRELHPDRFSRD